jgi:hypothetical protein
VEALKLRPRVLVHFLEVSGGFVPIFRKKASEEEFFGENFPAC